MTRLEEEAPANSVPAAAVRQGGQVLFGMTGRKGHVGCLYSSTLDKPMSLLFAIKTKLESRIDSLVSFYKQALYSAALALF